MILPLLHYSYWPTISSMSMTPKTISLERGHHRSQEGTCFIRVEDWDNDHYWITCHINYTGVEFAIRVGQDLVIDPNPQDMLSQLDWVGHLMWLWGGDIFLNSFNGPKGCNIGDWEGDVRCKGEESVGKGYVEWVVRTKDMEHQIGCATSSINTSSFTLLMILWTFLTPLILNWQLTHYDSHTLEAVSHSSLSQVIRSSLLSIYILFFPWWVTVFCFITHFFLIYHLICHVVLWRNFLEDSYDSLMSNCLQISEMLLSCSGFPHVYKEAVFDSEKRTI